MKTFLLGLCIALNVLALMTQSLCAIVNFYIGEYQSALIAFVFGAVAILNLHWLAALNEKLKQLRE